MALNREQKRQLKKKGEPGEGDEVDEAAPSRRSRTATKAAPPAKEQRTTARQFSKEVRSELRKVAWPTRKETMNYSLIVALTLVFMTTLIFGLDYVFQEVVLRLFNAK